MPQFKTLLSLVAAATVAAAAACGGSSPAAPSGTNAGGTTPGGSSGGASGPFTALIDGAPFNGSQALSATNLNNQLSISGSNGQYTLQLIVQLSRGAATYTFGALDPSNVTTAALALNGTAQNWFAGPGVGSGTITISSLTSSAVSGTFTVTVAPSAGGPATGNRVITSGVFNVPLTGSSTPAPAPAPPSTSSRTISATIDGTLWSGSGAALATRTQGLVTIAGADLQGRALSIAIFASAVGTYSLNPPNSHNGLYAAGSQQWFTSRAGGGGSVTIASIDASRVTGTFTMTLAPGPNNTDQRTLQAIGGTFDLAF